jgi:hypothetical protein
MTTPVPVLVFIEPIWINELPVHFWKLQTLVSVLSKAKLLLLPFVYLYFAALVAEDVPANNRAQPDTGTPSAYVH